VSRAERKRLYGHRVVQFFLSEITATRLLPGIRVLCDDTQPVGVLRAQRLQPLRLQLMPRLPLLQRLLLLLLLLMMR